MPSPDGTRIATLRPAHITVRDAGSLEVVRTVKLPAELAGGAVSVFAWSPSSRRVLLATADTLHVFGVVGADYQAIVRNPPLPGTRPAYVDFGATDDEVCLFSAYGIKLSLFHLVSSRMTEIANPKFYNAASASRGFSFRSSTGHLALLTRTGGKDTVSLHSPATRDVQRSWSPDVVDAQGLSWAPDGRWLVVWESAAQGFRVLFYTPDGHLFRDWLGPLPHAAEDIHHRLAAGIKQVAFSPDGHHMVIADHSKSLYLVSLSESTHHLQLQHPTCDIEPTDTLQASPPSDIAGLPRMGTLTWKRTGMAGEIPRRHGPVPG